MPTNRLANEQSPYLLQHQHNPVDWYPWGDEAFELARATDRPIFLSIGYATCHWCHVMEHESFEDASVAALMNEAFVSVKVDREERPDIDAIYMQVCQLMSGRCGWPLNVLLTPEGAPFYVTTYLPRTSHHGRIGMLDFVPRIAEVWASRRADVEEQADELREALQAASETPPAKGEVDPAVLRTAYLQFEQRYDARYGGFGNAPKFPSPHNLIYLLRYGRQYDADHAIDMAVQTLLAMRAGGIFDHVGFGFHRYATDASWLVPHFEKMLYDQALLLLAYAEAYAARPIPRLRQTAKEVMAYVLRDLSHPQGSFFSAEDADSEGVEGKFYIWALSELLELLSVDELRLVTRVYNLTSEGNFLEEATQRRTGENILHQQEPQEDLAASLGMEPDDLALELGAIRERLLEVRTQRIRPLLDDKVLTDWNGLMVAALARAGRLLSEPSFVAAAERALTFVRDHLQQPDGLLHRYRAGESGIEGMADDYAFMIWGLLETYQATYDVAYLTEAVALAETMHSQFWDTTNGGFFFTARRGERLLVRSKEQYDGAIPSANSIMYSNLLRLYRLTGTNDWSVLATELEQFMAPAVGQVPSAFCGFLLGLLDTQVDVQEVVLVGATLTDLRPMRALVDAARGRSVEVLCKTTDYAAALAEVAPYTAAMEMIEGKPTAYVCADFVCNQPTTDLATLKAYLTGATSVG